MRICSLLPSGTEIVAALGLGKDLVGISHTCDYPPSVAHAAVVTKSLRNPGAGMAGAAVHTQYRPMESLHRPRFSWIRNN